MTYKMSEFTQEELALAAVSDSLVLSRSAVVSLHQGLDPH